MNAINFIKHYGLNTAIRIIEDSKNDDFWDTETAFYTDKNSESCVCLSELKHLVESVDLIKKHGGLFSTKCQLDKGGSDYEWYGENGDYGLTDLGDLEQAIADYESIYCVADIEKYEFELGLAHDEQYVKSGGEHV